MFALRRRAPSYLKSSRYNIGSSHGVLSKLDNLSCNLREDGCISVLYKAKHGNCASLLLKHGFSNFFNGRLALSSLAGAKSSGFDDNLKDGSSELDRHTNGEAPEEYNSEGESASKYGLSCDEASTKETPRNKPESAASFELFKIISSARGCSVSNALDKLAKEKKDFNEGEISQVMRKLCKRLMYGRALQLLKWLESNKKIDFVEKDHASRLKLIGKAHGIQQAQDYIDKIPKSFRGEIVYQTMLVSCVSADNLVKAEEVFKKMRKLKLPITLFACNQLLTLYKRHDKKKMVDILLLMEKENVKPCLNTYKHLIDAKGSDKDITGMDQIVEAMKEEGIEPDISIKACLAKHYAEVGLNEKTELVLKEIEGDNLSENRSVYRILLPLYAQLGKADEVRRVWEFCETNLELYDCIAAIEAWRMLKKAEEAEAVFEKMISTWKKVSIRHYAVLLEVYADQKMVTKGMDLIKCMLDSVGKLTPTTIEIIVKFHVRTGEVEKADSILEKATRRSKKKPFFSSYMILMDVYAKRGDIHNAEKIFDWIKQIGYRTRTSQVHALSEAYLNTKAPACGMRDRLKADPIV